MPERYDLREIPVQVPGAVAATGAGQEFPAGDAAEIMFVIACTALTGSFIPKLQFWDTLANAWIDLPGGATASIAAPGNVLFHLGSPAIVANVSTTLPPVQRMRWFYTVTTGPATFGISAHMRLR